jgi:hypothetical protein
LAENLNFRVNNQRVILMSGSIFSSWARVENPSEVSKDDQSF